MSHEEFSLNVGQRFDDYVVVSEIGSGAMGRVYEVEDVKLHVHRAVKFFCPQYDGDTSFLKSCFFEEAKILCAAGEKCKNIVPIHSLNDVGSSDVPPYFVMDCIKGADGKIRTLADVPDYEDYNTPENAIQWFLDIAGALQSLHAQGIVHRDVKPSNILIDKDGHARLADFGIAKIAARGEDDNFAWNASTRGWFSHGGRGTPGFAAPEMEDSQAPITPAADVYSLGATFLEFVLEEDAKVNRDYFADPDMWDAVDPRWRAVLPAMLEAQPTRRLGLEKCIAIVSENDRHVPWNRIWTGISIAGFLAAMLLGVWIKSQMPDGREPSTVDVGERYALSVEFSRRRLFQADNQRKAYEWVLSAANDDYVPAQRELAFVHKEGKLGMPENPNEAFFWFKRAADNGDVDSQYDVARYYIDGLPGEPTSDDLALPYLKSAASNGIMEAQCELGTFYRDARGGLSTNIEMAVRLYLKAAAFGDCCAKEYLYQILGTNRSDGYYNPIAALNYVKDAAEQGSAYAATELGDIYALGWPDCNIQKDEHEATRWFETAVNAEDERPIAVEAKDLAHSYLGYFYQYGIGGLPKDVEKAKEEFSKSKSAYSRKCLADILVQSDGVDEQRRGLQLQRELVDEGDTAALLAVGWCHWTGAAGLPKDPCKAYQLFSEAASRSNCCALACCGVMEMSGVGVHQADPTNAVKLFNQCVELGCPVGMCALADAYRIGACGLSVDNARAFDLYRKSAELGYARAECAVGELCETGIGPGEASVDTARSWYEHAAERGDARSMAHLARMYYHGIGVTTDVKRAMSLSQAAVAKKDSLGKFMLGACLEAENNDGESDLAFRCMIEAANEGCLEACDSIGHYYLRKAARGDDRYESADLAMKYLSRVVKNSNHAHARGGVGYLMLYDWGSYAPNCQKGLRMLRDAADAGDAWSCNKYGSILCRGTHGVVMDKKVGVNYLRKASIAQLPAGDYNYAVSLYYGDGGMQTNVEKAIYLMRRAAQRGVGNAKAFLDARHIK